VRGQQTQDRFRCFLQNESRPCSGAGRRWFAVHSAEGAAAAAAHSASVERAVVVVGGAPTASSETAGARRVADVAPPLAAWTEFSLARSFAPTPASSANEVCDRRGIIEWPVSFRVCH
jgi:hypothetical protein